MSYSFAFLIKDLSDLELQFQKEEKYVRVSHLKKSNFQERTFMCVCVHLLIKRII